MMDQILNYKKNPDDDFYAILGCSETATPEQIQAEYRALALRFHPDKLQSSEEAAETSQSSAETVERRFQRLQRAKQVLTDPELRQIYDRWRGSFAHMPFEEFLTNKQALLMSMHWRCDSQRQPMVTDGQPVESAKDEPQKPQWTRENNDLLRKFRNYQL